MIKVQFYLTTGSILKSYHLMTNLMPLLMTTDTFITIDKKQYYITRRNFDVDENLLNIEVAER